MLVTLEKKEHDWHLYTTLDKIYPIRIHYEETQNPVDCKVIKNIDCILILIYGNLCPKKVIFSYSIKSPKHPFECGIIEKEFILY